MTTNWARVSSQETNKPDRKAYNNAVTQINLANIAHKHAEEPLWDGDTLGVRDLSKTLAEAGEAVLSEPRTNDPGWFIASEKELRPLIDTRNLLWQTRIDTPTEYTQAAYATARQSAARAIRTAKNEHSRKLAETLSSPQAMNQ